MHFFTNNITAIKKINGFIYLLLNAVYFIDDINMSLSSSDLAERPLQQLTAHPSGAKLLTLIQPGKSVHVM